MCRSIVRLREGAVVRPRPEMEAAARQFVRKVSGFSVPAPHNADVFESAVREITDAVERLMEGLVVRGAH